MQKSGSDTVIGTIAVYLWIIVDGTAVFIIVVNL